MESKEAFAEVIQSSLDTFVAQCWDWEIFPKFGSLVYTSHNLLKKRITIIGTVTDISTGSIDPIRSPFTYKKTEEELKKEQPQIFEFLKTSFTVKVLGYKENNNINYILPPVPAKIHTFVQNANVELSSKFFSQPDFLYLLFSSQSNISHFDDLLISILKRVTNIESIYKTLSLLTGNDYRKLKLLLKRTESLL